MVEKEYTKIPTKEFESGFEKKPDPPKYGFGVRHVQALIIFTAYAIGYIARSHLGVTIVAMTNDADSSTKLALNSTLNNTDITELINSTIVNEIDAANDSVTNVSVSDDSIWNIYQQYHWSKPTQEMVLSSFFVGYAIMTFLSGPICQRWGGKIQLQIAMLVNGIVSILSPWVVAWGGWKALCFCRILQGLSQGGLLPSLHTILANWVPLSERGTLSSYVFTGSGFGTVVGFQFSGVLATSSLGWPSPFWGVGIFCLVGFVLVTVFGAATPDDHKTISQAEKDYIIGASGEGTHTQPRVPWKAIMTSKHTWATFITHISSASTYVFFFIQVPTYLYAILKVNIKNSGLFSSLPYVFAFFSCIFFGFLSDFLINRNLISMRNARRFSNSIGSVVPAICLGLVSYTTNVTVAVICFVTAVGSHAAVHSGWVVNYIDLSPNYSGVLMAIGNGMGNGFVLVLSTFISFIVKDVTDAVQWRMMMFIMAGFNLLGNTIFFLFSSTDVQPWNDDHNKEPEEIKLQTEKDGLKTLVK